MQAAGARAEIDVHAFGVRRVRLRAVPQARPAVNAFFAVERGHAVRSRGDGLTGTGVNADARRAACRPAGSPASRPGPSGLRAAKRLSWRIRREGAQFPPPGSGLRNTAQPWGGADTEAWAGRADSAVPRSIPSNPCRSARSPLRVEIHRGRVPPPDPPARPNSRGGGGHRPVPGFPW